MGIWDENRGMEIKHKNNMWLERIGFGNKIFNYDWIIYLKYFYYYYIETIYKYIKLIIIIHILVIYIKRHNSNVVPFLS